MIRFKKHLITGSLILGALAVPALGLADDTTAAAPAATPVATPTPMSWYQKITVGGYLDEYYQLDFNQPANVGGLPNYRAFDNTTNQFSFGGGELTLTQNDSASNSGYFVDLLMGPEAGIYSGDGSNNGVEIGQAYLTQTFGNAKFTFGKFGTPVGYEVTYLPSNANFSRSLLYTQEPLYHVGLEMAYTLPMSWVATLWADDGNSYDNPQNAGKDYGAQLAYTGVKNLSLTGTWYLNNDMNLNVSGVSDLYDIEWGNFIASYTATSELTFAGEYLYKQYALLGNGVWSSAGGPALLGNYDPIQQGYALYATYSPASMANWSLSPRFEQWYNPTLGFNNASFGGFLGGYLNNGSSLPGSTPNVLDDYTLTLKYQMGPLAHMLEYRADATSFAGFTTSNGKNNYTFPSKVQQTLTYAAVYSF
jgi:hypothetical protein